MASTPRAVACDDAVDRLRGDEGTDVTIVVRQPKEQKSRTIKITRGQLPHATVRGIRKPSTGQWKTRLDGPGAVGFIRIGEISASTPHELRKLARLARERRRPIGRARPSRAGDGESTLIRRLCCWPTACSRAARSVAYGRPKAR